MKKLFLFTCLTASALFFNSCSKDDNNSSTSNTGATVSFKVGGVQKTFNTATVHDTPVPSDNYTWREVTASSNGSSTEMLSFDMDKDDTGADQFQSFQYKINSDTFSPDWDNFSSNTTSNNSSKLKGTFSGKVVKWDETSQTYIVKQITDGTFDINI